MVQGGFTPWEALRGGTLDCAWYLGLDGDVGSLEVGKLADLAIIDGNPIEEIWQSELVTHSMVNGRLYDTATMNQIAPERSSSRWSPARRPAGSWLRSFSCCSAFAPWRRAW